MDFYRINEEYNRYLQTYEKEKKRDYQSNVIKLSTDDHWQSLQKTLKPGMEQSFNQIVIPGLFFCGLFEQL